VDIKPLKLEIEKRRLNNEALIKAQSDIALAVQQYTSLDAGFQSEIDSSRLKLESLYMEYRHYSVNWPVVYANSLINKYPYYSGETDNLCNPYFKMSEVKLGNPGIEPIVAPITRTQPTNYARFRTYEKEDVSRSAALIALMNYPDHTNESLLLVGSCIGAIGSTQAQCIANGGTWQLLPPVWVPELTAVGLLKSALNSWKTKLTDLVSNVYDSSSTVTFWQNILDELNLCLTLLPPEPSYPNQTPIPTGNLLISINKLKAYAGISTSDFVSQRLSELQQTSTKEETKWFGLIKLRLHMINGSFSKLKAISNQKDSSASLIKDNKDAIATLTNIIISQ